MYENKPDILYFYYKYEVYRKNNTKPEILNLIYFGHHPLYLEGIHSFTYPFTPFTHLSWTAPN